MRKLTSKEKTKAYTKFARIHDYYVRTVRACAILRFDAVELYRKENHLN